MDCQNTVTYVVDKQAIEIRPPTLAVCLLGFVWLKIWQLCSLCTALCRQKGFSRVTFYGPMQRRAVQRTQVCVCVLVRVLWSGTSTLRLLHWGRSLEHMWSGCADMVSHSMAFVFVHVCWSVVSGSFSAVMSTRKKNKATRIQTWTRRCHDNWLQHGASLKLTAEGGQTMSV